jgi:hypothetical protein
MKTVTPRKVTFFESAPLRYSMRVRAVRDGAGDFDIRIDGCLRFHLECDSQWPLQWRLFPVIDGARTREHVALENEYWDILHQLERGEHWLPAEAIDRTPDSAPREATYVRFPEYLGEHP